MHSIGVTCSSPVGTLLTTAPLLCARALCALPTTCDGLIIASWVVSPRHPALRPHMHVWFLQSHCGSLGSLGSMLWQRLVCKKFISECSWDRHLWKKSKKVGLDREKGYSWTDSTKVAAKMHIIQRQMNVRVVLSWWREKQMPHVHRLLKTCCPKMPFSWSWAR